MISPLFQVRLDLNISAGCIRLFAELLNAALSCGWPELYWPSVYKNALGEEWGWDNRLLEFVG